MTKSIQITFNETDESLLMALFKKLKVKTKKIEVQKVEDDEPTKAEILEDLRIALEEVKAAERGEIQLISWEEMMAELRKEVAIHHPDYKPKKAREKQTV